MSNRWWIYQKSRFPVLAHGPMVLIFCIAVLTFAAVNRDAVPEVWAVVAATVSAVIFFFQLRVADEFKDFETDAEFRPHRPVPSGLVSLRELAWLAAFGAVIQFGIAIWFDVGLVPLLGLVWLYIALMTREFFIPGWLKRTPVAYLLSHMIVMPLIAFYISAFDWLPHCETIPGGIGWLLLLAFSCGIVLEVGRKIRSPEDERTGVETYSGLWGGKASVLVWILAVLCSVYAYLEVSRGIAEGASFIWPGIIAGGSALAIAVVCLAGDCRRPAARWIEPGSGIVAMLLYVGIGPLQLIV